MTTIIDDLSVDVLLLIFNLMTLYEKLIAMRVSKRWNSILKDTHAWPVMNFFQGGPVIKQDNEHHKRFIAKQSNNMFEFREYVHNSRWKFPINEDAILNCLDLCAGEALREVYLPVANAEIMGILRRKCPNLSTLSFTPDIPQHNSEAYLDPGFIVDLNDVEENIYFPPKLKHLVMTPPEIVRRRNIEEIKCQYTKEDQKTFYLRQQVLRDEKILTLLSNCSDLQHVYLRHCKLTSDGLLAMAQMRNLRRIEFIMCSSYSYDSNKAMEMSYDDLLTSTLGTMTSLTHLKLVGGHWQPLTRFFRSVCFNHLKAFSSSWIPFDREEFQQVLPGLMNLESLELFGGVASPTTVFQVGKCLTNLKSLVIECGCYTSESVRSLLCHPNLESLSVTEDDPNGYRKPTKLCWLKSMYDVLLSLPKLKRVKLAGYHLPLVYKQNTLPTIEGVEIEIIDMIYVTRLHCRPWNDNYTGYCRPEEVTDQQDW